MEQNIRNVNILLTCADNRIDDKTSTFMDGGPSNCGWGPDLINGLSGGIAIPLVIALASLLDMDGS